jgi:hypothetical protein
MATMDFDLAAIPREFPQFGKSVWNLGRTREEVFGGKGSKCGTAGAGSGKCADAGCSCSGCGCEGGSCGCSSGGGCGSTGGRHAQDAEGDPFGLGDPQVPVDPVYAARRDWGPRTSGGLIRRTEGGIGRSECDSQCVLQAKAFEQMSAFAEAAYLAGDVNMYYHWRYQLRMAMDWYKQCPVPPCPALAMPAERFFEPPQRTVSCHAYCYKVHWDCMFCHYVEGGDLAKATPDCNRACDAATLCKRTWADCPDPGPRWRPHEPPDRPPEPFDPEKDYCGPEGVLGFFIPDVDHEVKMCCYLHDVCYGFGGSEVDRTFCDFMFWLCLIRANGPTVASMYYAAVSQFGSFYFRYN